MKKKSHRKLTFEEEILRFLAFTAITLLVSAAQEKGTQYAENWYQRRKQAGNADYVDFEEVK